MADDWSGKWGYSTDQEKYSGAFDTKEQAAAECGEPCWVGQYVRPVDPWAYLDGSSIIDDVMCQDDYSFDFSDTCFAAGEPFIADLTNRLRAVFREWCEQHDCRPAWWVVDPRTVERIDPEEPADG